MSTFFSSTDEIVVNDLQERESADQHISESTGKESTTLFEHMPKSVEALEESM